jgi:predicted double-glycine peptidase
MVQHIIDAIATIAAQIEALTHPGATILPNFPRSLQLDSFSCGAKSVYCILQYYDRQCTPESVEEQLHTDEDGEHYAVVYGYSSSHIFVSNPSLNILTGYGSLSCAIPKSEFQKIWDRWGVIVNG